MRTRRKYKDPSIITPSTVQFKYPKQSILFPHLCRQQSRPSKGLLHLPLQSLFRTERVYSVFCKSFYCNTKNLVSHDTLITTQTIFATSPEDQHTLSYDERFQTSFICSVMCCTSSERISTKCSVSQTNFSRVCQFSSSLVGNRGKITRY